MKTVKLPDKPSELLELAMNDMEAAERSGKYNIDMDFWHCVNRYDGVCNVCLAGSVMARSLGIDHRETAAPETIKVSDDVRGKLWALNSFRCGEIGEAYSNLGRKMPDTLPLSVEICDGEYTRAIGEQDDGRFKDSMRQLITLLKEAGE